MNNNKGGVVRKFAVIMMVLCLTSGIVLTGCGIKKAVTSEDAIKAAQAIEGKHKQERYLLDQAQEFSDAGDFKGALELARYILTSIDRRSSVAREMIQKIHDAREEYLKTEREKREQAAKKGTKK